MEKGLNFWGLSVKLIQDRYHAGVVYSFLQRMDELWVLSNPGIKSGLAICCFALGKRTAEQQGVKSR